MRIENANASDVLERILSAYGFTMQKELAERLEIAKSNVAGWLQRGQVPGNVIVQCALDTGADVKWIVTGELAKAKYDGDLTLMKGKALYDEIISNGGKLVLRRIMDAYGFTLQKQLCDLLDISSGTVSTWVRRGYFPGDVVVTCALDTNVSLSWLATGRGGPNAKTSESKDSKALIPKKLLSEGSLLDCGYWNVDLEIIKTNINSPIFVFDCIESWVVDIGVTDVSNGRWLLSVDGKIDVYNVSILPGKNLNVKRKGSDFTCGIDEILPLGKVKLTLNYES
jgi:transcriptional regulator with XRE-family HTH domain